MASFAERLEKLINEKEITLEYLAGKIDITKSTLSRYKNGKREPKMHIVEKLANYFEVSIDYLMGNSDTRYKDDAKTVAEIPVLGCIAAGEPLLSEENIIEYKRVPAQSVGDGEYFYLKVKGDSMINAGIKEGDLALVKSQKEIKHKDIAVVMVNKDEATLKRVFKTNGSIILQPENSNYEPIVVNNKDARIIGKVVGITRDFQ